MEAAVVPLLPNTNPLDPRVYPLAERQRGLQRALVFLARTVGFIQFPPAPFFGQETTGLRATCESTEFMGCEPFFARCEEDRWPTQRIEAKKQRNFGRFGWFYTGLQEKIGARVGKNRKETMKE